MQRSAIVLWVLAAVVLRLSVGMALVVWGAGSTAFREPDSLAYVRCAESLAATGGFSRDCEPELLRTPGYPLFLSVGVRLERVEALALVLQALLGGLTVALVYRLALGLEFEPRAALAAAGFACLEPTSVLYSNKLLAEALFVACLCAALVALVDGIKRSSIVATLAGMALMAAAAFVKPIAVALPPLAAIYVTLFPSRGVAVARRMTLLAACLLVGTGPLVAWIARNAAVADYWRFAAVADVNAYFWHAAAVEAASRNVDLRAVQRERGLGSPRDYMNAHPEQRDWSPGRRYDWMRDQAIATIRDNPAIFASQYARGITSTLADSGGEAWVVALALEGRPRVAARVALAGALVIYYGAAVCGLWFGRRTWRTTAGALVLLVALYLLLLAGGSPGYHRLRCPIMPVVCLLAGVGAAGLTRPREVPRAPAGRAT